MGSVVGPVLGGLLKTADQFGLSWRPVFFINVPVGLVVIIPSAGSVRQHRPDTPRTIPCRLRHPGALCPFIATAVESTTRTTRHGYVPANTGRPSPLGSPRPPGRPAPPILNSSANNWRSSWTAPPPQPSPRFRHLRHRRRDCSHSDRQRHPGCRAFVGGNRGLGRGCCRESTQYPNTFAGQTEHRQAYAVVITPP